MIGDEVRVTRGEAAVEDDFLVRLAVAVRIAEPDDVRLRDDDHAVFIVTEAGDEFESFVEELLLVGLAVAVGVDEHADLILGRAIIAAGHQHPALAPGFGGQRSSAVRVFGGLGDPEAAALIPLHGDGLVDEGLGHDDAGLKAGLHLESGDGLLGATRTADGVTQVDEVLRRAKFVHVAPTSGPGDATLDEGAVAGMGERLGFALQEDRRTEARILEDPGLRLDVVDGGLVGDFGDVLTVGADLRRERGSEHVDLLVELEVEDRLVGHVEGRGVLGQRMGVRADVEHHQGPEAAALRRPTRAERITRPGSGRPRDRTTKRDETDASVREIGQGRAIDDFVGSIVLTIKDDDLVLVVLGSEDVPRTVRFGHHGAGGGELGDERFDGEVVVGDDGDLERRGAKDGGGTSQGEAQERGDAGKHGLIK